MVVDKKEVQIPQEIPLPKVAWKTEFWLAFIPFILGFISFFFPELLEIKEYNTLRYILGSILLLMPVLVPLTPWFVKLLKAIGKRVSQYEALYNSHLRLINEFTDYNNNLYFFIEEIQKYRSKPKEEVDWLGLREGVDTRKSHITELYGILTATIMIRRLKQDVSKDLPNKIYSFVPVELNNVKEYNDAEKDFIAFIKRVKEPEITTKASSSQTPASIEGLLLLTIKGKLSQCTEWIKNFLEVGSKLVVFTKHKFVIEALINAFPKISVRIDRSVTAVERKKAVDDFQTNPDIRLFVADIEAAEGEIKLTTESNIAFLEIPLSLGKLSKAENFCQRTGKKVSVNIYYLFAASTIEERVVKLIDKRLDLSGAILEGSETDTASMLSELMKDYE